MTQPVSSQSAAGLTSANPPRSVFAVLLPITLAVFIGFLALGVVLPVLPLHIHGELGMSTLVVGTVAGAQFAAALLSRAWAGGIADIRGAKVSVVSGQLASTLAGVCYLLSTHYAAEPTVAVGILLLGRVLQGSGESLIVTGALSWGVGLVGPQNAGKVMAWVGIAIYGAYAAGAPVGVHFLGSNGFVGVATVSALLPLIGWAVIATVKPIAPSAVKRVPFYRVLSSVWLPGLGLALSSVGFGLLTAFVSLLFAGHAWGSASLMFTAFGVSFIAARLLFGHLPDKVGGAKVALVCVLIEAAGQLLIWLSSSPQVAYVGAALTGFGYSLAFPGFGVEAVKRAPPQNRGAAMGAYVAFLDIALGVASPGAGAIANAWGVDAVYLAGTVAVAMAVLVATRLLLAGPTPTSAPVQAA